LDTDLDQRSIPLAIDPQTGTEPPFLTGIFGSGAYSGGSYEEYNAAVKAAITHGLITLHPSGAYLSFTQEGADLFA
jgi:hypothetical protein